MKNKIKQWHRCEDCGGRILPVIYGMPKPGDEKIEAIFAGCIIEGDQPYAECEQCGKPSTKLPRDHKTIIDIRRLTFGARPSKGDETFDLEQLTTSQIEDLALGLLEARYELVARGFTPQEVDAFCELNDGLPMPISSPVSVWLFFDADANRALSICKYYADGNWALFEYLLPGQDEWGEKRTAKDFSDFVFANRRPNLEVWEITETDEYNEDEPDLGQSWGSYLTRIFMDGGTITRDMLQLDCNKLPKVIFWPNWFDPGNLNN